MVNFVLRIRHKAEWYWKTRALRICPGTKNRKGETETEKKDYIVWIDLELHANQ
jgi:hypothetical protein